ncbi:MAG: hypothetical protein BWY86_00787 [Candidatus Aminicenantes bacterium ADurb.Bin508]|nr:MAG: hypothetical protein BWY86_00787 [Candidatus Aminicenantes bacterium ADurb.Bin508]
MAPAVLQVKGELVIQLAMVVEKMPQLFQQALVLLHRLLHFPGQTPNLRGHDGEALIALLRDRLNGGVDREEMALFCHLLHQVKVGHRFFQGGSHLFQEPIPFGLPADRGFENLPQRGEFRLLLRVGDLFKPLPRLLFDGGDLLREEADLLKALLHLPLVLLDLENRRLKGNHELSGPLLTVDEAVLAENVQELSIIPQDSLGHIETRRIL